MWWDRRFRLPPALFLGRSLAHGPLAGSQPGGRTRGSAGILPAPRPVAGNMPASRQDACTTAAPSHRRQRRKSRLEAGCGHDWPPHKESRVQCAGQSNRQAKPPNAAYFRTLDIGTDCGAANPGCRRLSSRRSSGSEASCMARKSRLKGGCGQDWPPHNEPARTSVRTPGARRTGCCAPAASR